MSSAPVCGKVCYPTAASAWRSIRALERRRRRHGSRRRRLVKGSRPEAYRCSSCNAWHVTNEAW